MHTNSCIFIRNINGHKDGKILGGNQWVCVTGSEFPIRDNIGLTDTDIDSGVHEIVVSYTFIWQVWRRKFS